jgi:surface antigen
MSTNRTIAIMIAVAALAFQAGCADVGNTVSSNPKATVGTLAGAAAGGLLGSQFGRGSGKLAATGAGVLLGGLLGGQLGKQLDDADKTKVQLAQQQAYNAPIGTAIAWNNPQSQHYGAVTPIRDGYGTNGAYCREFQQAIVVNGQTQQAYGRACRQPDNSWQIVQ